MCLSRLHFFTPDGTPVNSPHHFRTLYSAVVAENSPSGTLLVTVAASDADEGANARQIHYLSGESEELFSVGADTGEIRTAIPLDRLDSEPIQGDHGGQ